MKSVMVCPECKKLVHFNSYFGAYICENCGWEDASYAQKRDSCVGTTEAQTIFKVRCSDGTLALVRARLAQTKLGSNAQAEKAIAR